MLIGANFICISLPSGILSRICVPFANCSIAKIYDELEQMDREKIRETNRVTMFRSASNLFQEIFEEKISLKLI